MKDFEIIPQCAPPGSKDYCLCDEGHATRWVVSKGFSTYGWFDSRALAEAYVKDVTSIEGRVSKFTWGPDDVEHH